ncbi:fumarate hydratase C-terminal domain-containing protein [Shigella flexneri]
MGRDIAHGEPKERLDTARAPQTLHLPDRPRRPGKCWMDTPPAVRPNHGGRMDSYVDQLQANGGSMIMLAKGTAASR